MDLGCVKYNVRHLSRQLDITFCYADFFDKSYNASKFFLIEVSNLLLKYQNDTQWYCNLYRSLIRVI